MRKLIVVNMMTLDGFFAGREADVSVLPYDDAFVAYNVERIKAADAVLLGGTSYRDFSGFWPTLADDRDASPDTRQFAQLYNRIDKIAVSRTLTHDDLSGPWADNTRIIADDVYQQVADLLEQDGGAVVSWASRRLWSDLVNNGIEAELHLVVGNQLIGAGVPLFEDVDGDRVTLRGVDTPRRLPDSENVLIKYALGPSDRHLHR